MINSHYLAPQSHSLTSPLIDWRLDYCNVCL